MRKVLAIASAVALLGFAGSAQADGTLDGIIGSNYGAAVGTDTLSDASNGNAILDCQELYVYDDGPGTNAYIAMRVGGDIVGTDWGKYMFFIQTNNQTTTPAGATNRNGWQRPIDADGTNIAPTYWLASWVDSGTGWELYQYSGAGTTWSLLNASYAVDGGASVSRTSAAGSSTVEFRVPRNLIGTPSNIKVVGMSSGGGGGDNAQDSVPSAGQAAGGDWGALVTLNASAGPVTVPVTVSTFLVD